MRNIYYYELAKARLKPKVKRLIFDKILEAPKTYKLAEIISLLDVALEREMKRSSLSPIPENSRGPEL